MGSKAVKYSSLYSFNYLTLIPGAFAIAVVLKCKLFVLNLGIWHFSGFFKKMHVLYALSRYFENF